MITDGLASCRDSNGNLQNAHQCSRIFAERDKVLLLWDEFSDR